MNIKHFISAVTFVVILSVVLQLAGCEINDYDGKQVLEQIQCQDQGGKMVTRQTGILLQSEYACELPQNYIPREFEVKNVSRTN